MKTSRSDSEPIVLRKEECDSEVRSSRPSFDELSVGPGSTFPESQLNRRNR